MVRWPRRSIAGRRCHSFDRLAPSTRIGHRGHKPDRGFHDTRSIMGDGPGPAGRALMTGHAVWQDVCARMGCRVFTRPRGSQRIGVDRPPASRQGPAAAAPRKSVVHVGKRKAVGRGLRLRWERFSRATTSLSTTLQGGVGLHGRSPELKFETTNLPRAPICFPSP